MTQPVRLAMLKGGNRLHLVKNPLWGDFVARCGMKAYLHDYWDFNPPPAAKKARDGPVLCAYCHGAGDEEARKWDSL